MKPQLKGGRPIGQRLSPQPGNNHPIYICRCEFCQPFGKISTADGNIDGRIWYSYAEFQAHRGLADTGVRSSPSGDPVASMPLPVPTEDGSLSSEERAGYSEDGPMELGKIQQVRTMLSRMRDRISWEPTEIEFASDVTSSRTLPQERDLYVLLKNRTVNSALRGHLQWLQQTKEWLDTLTRKTPSFNNSTFQLQRELAMRELNAEEAGTWQRVSEEWRRQRKIALSQQKRVKAKSLSYGDIEPTKRVFLVIWVLAAVLHLICHTALNSMGFFLCVMRLVLQLESPSRRIGPDLNTFLPKDMRTVITRLDLEPSSTTFACCPRCFHLHDIDRYPKYCDNRVAPKSRACGRRLRPHSPDQRSSKSTVSSATVRPVRTYTYQDLCQWIGWMYSRPDMEQWLDRRLPSEPRPDGTVHDIWDTEYLRSFLGPDGRHPFLSPDPDPNESRLIFILNADGFNPYGNRQAGKKVSVMGIYLVCMNLPPSLRHKPENVFLAGVVPGPKEPSMEQINYVLKPLVDDLHQLWHTGIFINRTKTHRQGRSVRAALIALVCDMPAARLLGGFAHYRSGQDPCSMCKQSDLNDLDESHFVPRTAEEHRRLAEEWLEADTEEERTKRYKANGVRYSELLRLPYWDPIQNTILDSMHGFYLRILQRHCRNVWKMGANFTDNEGLWAIEELSDEEKATAQWTFRYGSRGALRKLRSSSIRFLAIQEVLDYRRNKSSLVEMLLQLRVQKQWFTSSQELINENVNLADIAASPILNSDQPVVDDSAVATQQSDFQRQLAEARDEYHNGKYLAPLKEFHEDVIRVLAKESDVTATTPSGKVSNHKGPLLKALINRRKEVRSASSVAVPPPTLPPPPPPPHSSLSSEPADAPLVQGQAEPLDDITTALETSSKTKINQMNWRTLYNMYRIIRRARASVQSTRTTEEHIGHRAGSSDSSREGSVDEESDRNKGSSSDTSDGELSSDASGTGEAEALSYDSDPDTLNLDEEGAKSHPGARKQDLLNYIHAYRVEAGLTNKLGKLPKGKTNNRKKTGVLGSETLRQVRRDMGKLQLPTWMAKAPSRPGEAQQGKYSADQWRAFCTVNLPVTLIRLWGSQSKDGRQYQMLAHYMHLVTAVRLANMRVMTEDRILAFEEQIRIYLRDLNTLYPHTNISNYQHMVLHFGNLLRRFGPVHSWRCFAFERLNYVLQQTKTNSRQGELEHTMFQRFCMTQRLRSIFHGKPLPSYLLSLAALYEEYFENADTRGTRISDVLAFEDPITSSIDLQDTTKLHALDPHDFGAVQSWAERMSQQSAQLSPLVHERERVQWRDFTFTTKSCSFPDSQVVFNTDDPFSWGAGSITRLFTASWTSNASTFSETFAQVLPYKPLSDSDAEFDEYRRFGFAGGRLFYKVSEAQPIILPIRFIPSHFGFSEQSDVRISGKTIHALPLNKVAEFDS